MDNEIKKRPASEMDPSQRNIFIIVIFNVSLVNSFVQLMNSIGRGFVRF